MKTIKCTQCGRELPESEFYKDQGRIKTPCKTCRRAWQRAYAKRRYHTILCANPEAKARYLAKLREWHHTNRDASRDIRTRYRARHKDLVRARGRLRHARRMLAIHPESQYYMNKISAERNLIEDLRRLDAISASCKKCDDSQS